MRDFLVITGPTTSGKTQLSIAVAETLDGEIIWDQIYGGPMIDIGRALIQNGSDGGFTLIGQTSSYGAGEYEAL